MRYGRDAGDQGSGDGVYFNTASWEFLDIPEDASKLQGDAAKGKMVRVPALVPLLVGPFAGLAFVIFVPLVGVISAVAFTWQRLAATLHIRHPRMREQHR